MRLAVTLAALFLAAAVVAQEPFVEEIEVRLLDLEVVVVDGEGRPVEGLGRDDFQLRHDGKKVAISHFAAAEAGRPAGAAGTLEGADEPVFPRLREDRVNVVVYLDRAYLEPGDLEGVTEALRGFLRTALGPRDRAMLVVADHSLTIAQSLTAVPELVLAQLDRLPPVASRGQRESELIALVQRIERAVAGGPDVPARARDEAPRTLKTEIDGFIAETYQELERATGRLERLLPALGGLPGRTAVLYLGGSPPTDAGQVLYNAWRRAFGPGSRYQMSRGSGRSDEESPSPFSTADGPTSEIDATRLLAEVAARANDFGVTVHAVDAGALRQGKGFLGRGTEAIREGGGDTASGRSIDLSRRLGNPRSLEMMAEATGGRAVTGNRDFQTALAELGRELRSYYVLGFTPEAELDADRQRLKVRLRGKHKGLQVRHRDSVRPRSRDQLAIDRVVSALLLEESHNPLAIELRAGAPRPIADDEERVLLPLTVVIPLASLTFVSGDEGERAQFSLYLTAGGLHQGSAPVQKAVVPITLARDELETSRQDGRQIEYSVDLPMPARSAAVAAALRDDLRPLTATVVLPLVRDLAR